MRLLRIPKAIVNRLGKRWCEYTTRREWLQRSFGRHNERGVEYSFVFHQISRLCPRTILDVGSGQSALPALMRTCGAVVTASDNVRNYWPSGMFNRHWHVVDDDITHSRLPGDYDMLTCISVLEHIVDFNTAVREMFRLLAPGGHLVLTCPYSDDEYVENVYKLPDARAEYRDEPYICRSYSRGQLQSWSKENRASVVEQQFWRIETGRFHAEGEWLFPAAEVARTDAHQLTCLLLRKDA